MSTGTETGVERSRIRWNVTFVDRHTILLTLRFFSHFVQPG
jgi:hypothetical protein